MFGFDFSDEPEPVRRPPVILWVALAAAFLITLVGIIGGLSGDIDRAPSPAETTATPRGGR